MSEHNLKEIESILNKQEYAVLNTLSDNEIHTRVMLFAQNAALNRFYMITDKHTNKVHEIEQCNTGTIAVLCQTDKLEDYTQIIMIGKLNVLTDFKETAVQEALTLLSQKNSMLQGLLQAGTLGNYCIIEFVCKRIEFITYNEALKHELKTILEV